MIRHIAGLAEVVEDVAAAVAHYRNDLGLSVTWEEGSPYAQVTVAGIQHFGLWSRAHAAERIFGSAGAIDRIPLGFHLEYEVDAVGEATATLAARGVTVVQPRQEEPWGQVTARYLSISGALVGVAETPWAREISKI